MEAAAPAHAPMNHKQLALCRPGQRFLVVGCSQVHACDNGSVRRPRRPRAGQAYSYLLFLSLSLVLLCCSWPVAAHGAQKAGLSQLHVPRSAGMLLSPAAPLAQLLCVSKLRGSRQQQHLQLFGGPALSPAQHAMPHHRMWLPPACGIIVLGIHGTVEGGGSVYFARKSRGELRFTG